jgi:hypothetical protein
MKVLLLVLFFGFFSTTKAAGIFDSNCLKLAQKQNYFKGSFELEKRLDRTFNYPQILGGYRQLQKELLNPVNSVCLDSVDYNECPDFQSYCLETIATEALKEDLTRWSEALQNCDNVAYLEKHPKHCGPENKRRLLEVQAYALEFADIEASRAAGNREFSRLAQEKFLPSANQPEKLLQKKKEEKKKRDDLKSMKRLIDKCNGVVSIDDNDVKDRNISAHLANSFNGICYSTPAAIDTTGAAQLRGNLLNVSTFMLAERAVPGILSTALEKSLTATWATHLQQMGPIRPDRVTFACKFFPDLCKTEKGKAEVKVLSDKFGDNPKTKEIKQWSAAEITRLKDEELNPLLQEFNKTCMDVHNKFKELDKKYSCAPVIDFSNPKNSRPPMTQGKCEGLREQWYQESKTLNIQFQSNLRQQFSSILGSPMGHLFLTPAFQEQVGTFGEDDTYAKCMKGPGVTFKEPKQADIHKAMQEFLALNIKDVLEISHDKLLGPQSSTELLKKYLKTNFVTIAQFLHDHPTEENGYAICQGIRAINQKETEKQFTENVITGVGVVSSVALAATGVGAPAAGLLMAAIAGSTVVQVASGIEGYLDAKNEAQRSTLAASTGQVELEVALEEIRKKNNEAKDKVDSMIMLLASEATGLAALNATKIFGKLSNSKTLLRLLRGKDTAQKIFEVKDLKKIQSGLETLKQKLRENNFRTKAFSSLSAEELAELGARTSSMSQKDLDAIFSGLKGTDNARFGRLFLQELRKGNFDVTRFNQLMAAHPTLVFPNGSSMTGYMTKVEKVIVEIQPKSVLRVTGNRIANTTANAGKGIKQYFQQVAASRGKRLFVKPRQQTPNRNVFKNLNGYLFNPHATLTNSTWQVTTPVSMVGYALIFEHPLAWAKKKAETGSLAMAKEDKEMLCGGEYVWDLYLNGMVDEKKIPGLFKRHDENLDRWLNNGRPEDLPRLMRLKEVFGLSDSEALLFSDVARKTYFEALDEFKKAGGKATKEEMSFFNEAILQKLMEKLNTSTEFSRFTPYQLELLSTLYQPIVPLKDTKRDDVELTKTLMELDRPEMQRIFSLLEKGITIGDAMMMTSQVLDQKEALEEKKAKAQKELSPELQRVADRPDIPSAHKEAQFKKFPGGPEATVTDEVDRWKLLSTDVRMKEVYDLYKEGAVDEVKAMNYVNRAIESYNGLYTLMEKTQKSGLTSELVQNVFKNPLMSGIKDDLEAGATQMKWSASVKAKKQKEVAGIWLEYHELVARGKNPDADVYYNNYQKVIGLQPNPQ